MDPYLQLAIAEGWHEKPVAALLDPRADPAELLAEPPTVPTTVARRLADPDLTAQAARLRETAASLGIAVVTPADAHYPERLRDAPLRPLALYVEGDPGALGRAPTVSVIGSRTPTAYGKEAAATFSNALAGAGMTVWSGLARGVDSIAHRQSLALHQPTVAVLAGGLRRIYPAEHQQLADQIVADGGCLLSELPPDRRARRGHFPRRNRILAGATGASLVIEAGATSGSLHTARFAGEYGRAVFCVPGPWSSERSRGCHRLLQEGASVAADPAELLRDLGVQPALGPGTAQQLQLSADSRAILTCLQSGPRPADLVERESGLPREQFLVARLQLEGSGAIHTMPGDLLATSP
ncbi:MAG: DNA-processing protein DprA [Planctomycetota bacterium]|nr:DNA-processing protein DprA [Planctomycetota bacterium]